MIAGRGDILLGGWTLQTVNGVPLEFPGIPIEGSTNRLRSGELEFDTKSCSSKDESKGVVIATYGLANNFGTPIFPSRTYAGSFEYNSATKTVILRAFGKEQTARIINDNLTVTANLSWLGAGEKTLVFH
jgi:hypothetical protein